MRVSMTLRKPGIVRWGPMTTDPREMAAAAIAYAKPRLRGWVHLVMAPIALAAGTVLIVLEPTAAGALIYGFKRPNPSPRWFGFHEIFHSLTVAGFICQYIAASLLIYRAA